MVTRNWKRTASVLAVNAETLEVIDELQLPEPAPSPHIITMFDGKIAIYVGLNQSLRRYFWDPYAKRLSADENWQVFPMQDGQSAATAPSVIGDRISVQLNGLFTDQRASSVVVVSQKDATKQHVIFPFGELDPGEWSFAPPKGTADPENSMINSADTGMKQVAGIRLDQATGEMELTFVVDNISNTFQPLIGPKDKRVLLLTNIKQNVAKEPIKPVVFTANYKEQLTWRDAATGRILAQSNFFEPLTINSLTRRDLVDACITRRLLERVS